MPTYEFRCNDTGKHFELHFDSIMDYEAADIVSPYTDTPNVTRIIREVNIAGKALNFESLMDGDADTLDALEHADPQTLGHSLRAMADEVGEDMGSEFNEIVSRLEAGQSPEEIEASVPPKNLDD